MPFSKQDSGEYHPALLDASLEEIIERAPVVKHGEEPCTGRTWVCLQEGKEAEGLTILSNLFGLKQPTGNLYEWLSDEGVQKRVRSFASMEVLLVAAEIGQIKSLDFIGFHGLEEEYFLYDPPVSSLERQQRDSSPHPALGLASGPNWALQLAGGHDIDRGSGVCLAVIDKGLDTKLRHFYELRPKPVRTINFTTHPNSEDVRASSDHGTWVTGVAAGPRAKSPADYGIAPDAELYIAKIGDASKKIKKKSACGVDGWLAAGIEWAAERARVGVTCLTRDGGCNYSTCIEKIVAKARSEKGFLLFCAAAASATRGLRDTKNPRGSGVSFGSVGHPGNCPSVVAVGGLTNDLWIWEESPRGQCGRADMIQFIGPAFYVRTTNTGDEVKGAVQKDGTSFAAPYVAGLAALHLEKNKMLTADELLAELCTTSCLSFHRRGAWEDARDWGCGYPVAPGIECPVWPPP